MPNRVPSHKPRRLAGPGRHREYDRTARDADGKRFYHSDAWLKLRRLKLSINPLCERCLKRGMLTPASIAHHKQERRDHPELALELDNLESLCASCHSSEHAQG